MPQTQTPWNFELSFGAARRYFWLGIVAFVLFGTFSPEWCGWIYRDDVLEQIAIGREWVTGSYKHPALTTWIVEIFRIATFKADFAPYLASTCCISAVLWACWRLSRNFMSERLALLAGFSPLLLRFFSIESHNYNNNVTLGAFWCLAIWAFHRALTTRKNSNWILTGVFLCAALLSKYSAFLLALTFPTYLLIDRKARASWKTPGPYLTIATTLILFAPHLVFFLRNYEKLSQYANLAHCSRSEFPLQFVVGWLKQLTVVGPIILALAPTIAWKRLKTEKKGAFAAAFAENSFDRGFSKTFLAAMFLLPFVFQTVVQIANSLPTEHTRHVTHLYPLLGAVLLYYFPIDRREKNWKTAGVLTFGIVAAMCFGPTLQAAGAYFIWSKPSERLLPAKETTAKVDDAWSERFPGVPMRCVAGNDPTTWMITTYSRFEPSLDSPRLGDWTTDADVDRRGGVVIWKLTDEITDENRIPEPLQRRFPRAEFVQKIELKHRQRNPKVPLYRVAFGFVPPPEAAPSNRPAANPSSPNRPAADVAATAPATTDSAKPAPTTVRPAP